MTRLQICVSNSDKMLRTWTVTFTYCIEIRYAQRMSLSNLFHGGSLFGKADTVRKLVVRGPNAALIDALRGPTQF